MYEIPHPDCIVTSTISRFEGDWMYTVHTDAPLYPGLSIRFKGRSYQIADDRTLKVRFTAASAEEARDMGRKISWLLNTKSAQLRAGILANAEQSSEKMHDALVHAANALDEACDEGFGNEWIVQECAKLLVAMGNLSFKALVSKSQSRLQARERAAAAARAQASANGQKTA